MGAARVAADDDKRNPFQVYPVRGLSENDDILKITVPTPEFAQVREAVIEFADAFGAQAEPYPKLLLAVQGDFGSGKTHMLLYAHAVLAEEIEKRRKIEPDLGPPIAVMVASREAPIEDWYASELGPLLMEAANRALVRELLARSAAEMAMADPDPDVRKLATGFRTSPTTLYGVLREPGSFDVSRLDEDFAAAIARVSPRTNRSFRKGIEALRWEETAELAEDWLAGNELSASEKERLDIRVQGDSAARAANTICAIATISRELRRPFALFIDEFEHLTRFDARNASKQNITWTKRLVESLARRGAIVFISGHWEAWDQQGDFLDRFVGGRPIQLLRLSEKDVLDVIRVRAGEGAWPGFSEDAARWVIEATAGNIRRVVTVLYDLWYDPAAPKRDVTENAVKQAAVRRLQPGSETGIIPAIEAAIRNAGGEVRRDEILADSRIDVTAYVGGELRLMATVIHARDELALIGNGERFASLVQQLRRDHLNCRGLVVMVGAVLQRQLSTLDAAFPETTMISGEVPGTFERLPALVSAALVPAPAPLLSPSLESQQALESERVEAVVSARAQSERSRAILGQDSRSEAVRVTVAPDELELERQESAARQRTFEAISEELREGFAPQYFAALLHSPTAILSLLTGLLILVSRSSLIQILFPYYEKEPLPGVTALLYASLFISVILLAFVLLYVIRLYIDLSEFRTYSKRALRAEFERGYPAQILLRRNTMRADMLAVYGPRSARLQLISDKEKER
jgi:hypothetical protein